MHPLQILCLEDNAVDQELLARKLKAAGIDAQCLFVDSKEGFREALEKQHFDLIIADYTVPAYSGSAALDDARQAAPETPFIFLSGTIGAERAIEALKRGAIDYVLKEHMHRLGPAAMRAVKEAAERAQRLRAEERLQEIEERYRAVFERSLDAVYLHDLQGRFLDANAVALTRIFHKYTTEAQNSGVEPIMRADWGSFFASHRRSGGWWEKRGEIVDRQPGGLS